MARIKWFGVLLLAAAAANGAAAVTADESYLLGAAFGAGSYETYLVTPRELDRANKLGFAFGGHFYRNQGRLTTLVRFDYLATKDYADRANLRTYDIDLLLPVYLTLGRLRPALVPLLGAHYVQGKGGGSQGELGVLAGIRYQIVPEKCTFTDLYLGWRGRYGALPGDLTDEPEGWKGSLVFRNADTIHVATHFCLYFTASIDYDLTKVRDENRKPILVMTGGPAASW